MSETASDSGQIAPAQSQWHALEPADCLDRLGSSASGLSAAEAEERLGRFGPNRLPEPPRTSALRRFLAQFSSGLIWFLIAAAMASFFLGHAIDGAVIAAVVLVNAVVGFVQEGKAEEALRAISDLVSQRATALREGKRARVDVTALVPGDVIQVDAGDKVPADARILRARALTVDEAILTGESMTAGKDGEAVAADAPLGDRTGMLYSGTLVKTGQATALVTGTGMDTEIGRISGLLSGVERLTTPLLRQINSFSSRFTQVIMAGSALLFAYLFLLRAYPGSEALLVVVALAVSLIPEGLPAVITITLAIGVRRMAARHAVIRKLPAVETLGAVSVICTDKTGTLTRNEMTVRRVFTESDEVLIAGAGYAPEGEITFSGRDASDAGKAVLPLAHCGMLCADAHFGHTANGWVAEGDPMEGALVALAMKAGLDPAAEREAWPRIDEIPFDAAHRYMATLHRAPDGHHHVFIKGAPEALLAMIGDPALHERWEQQIAAAASEGERLLGFATKRLEDAADRLHHEMLGTGIEAVGLAGFIDPPREEAREAVSACREAGIAVKMITGDHAATAIAIGRQLGLGEDLKAMTGAKLEKLDDAQLQDAVGDVAVFARSSPEHKLRIVKALQAKGQIVAMTGDGVNDAPSLKQADVGTAMGQKGTEASREASEMVLLDDNFASIVAAVREGRTVYTNIRKVIAWTLPTNGGESLAVLLAVLVGFTLPMTATQILWINLVTASTLGLALAFEPAEDGVMRRPPRRPEAPLLSGFMLWRVLLVSVLFTAVSLSVFFTALSWGRDLESARTMVVNMVVAAEIFYLFNVRFLDASAITWRGALGTQAVLIALAVVLTAQATFTYLPAFNTLFESRPLTLADLALIVSLGVGLMVVLELEKLVMRRLGWFDDLRTAKEAA